MRAYRFMGFHAVRIRRRALTVAGRARSCGVGGEGDSGRSCGRTVMSAARVRPNDACAQCGLLILSGARRHPLRPYCGQLDGVAAVVPLFFSARRFLSSISASLARPSHSFTLSLSVSFSLTRSVSSTTVPSSQPPLSPALSGLRRRDGG